MCVLSTHEEHRLIENYLKNVLMLPLLKKKVPDIVSKLVFIIPHHIVMIRVGNFYLTVEKINFYIHTLLHMYISKLIDWHCKYRALNKLFSIYIPTYIHIYVRLIHLVFSCICWYAYRKIKCEKRNGELVKNWYEKLTVLCISTR